jgi:hypothetical protein
MVGSLPATGCSIRMQYITRDLRNRGGLGLDKVDNPPPLVTNLCHSALSATDIRVIMIRGRGLRFIAFKVSDAVNPEIIVISRNSEFSQDHHQKNRATYLSIQNLVPSGAMLATEEGTGAGAIFLKLKD